MSYDYSKILAELRKSETVLEREPLDSFLKTWEIEFSFFIEESYCNTNLFICFTHEFPNTFPKILLRKDFIQLYGWLPHIEMGKSGIPYICIFDESIAEIIPGNELILVKESIEKAKKEIRAGISGSNYTDYLSEIQSYWTRKYNNEPKLLDNLLLIGHPETPQILEAHYLDQKIGNYSIIIFSETKESKLFKKNIFGSTVKGKKIVSLFIGEIKIDRPPYNIVYKDFFEKYLDQLNPFSSILDSESEFYLIAKIQIDSRSVYYVGWHIISEFRIKARKRKAITNSELTRLQIDLYSNERLMKRTTGEIENQELNEMQLFISGLGSIGSHLVDLLRLFSFKKMHLNDLETFKIENIKRHILGLNYINLPKSLAITNHISYYAPEINFECSGESILKILGEKLENINDFNFLFIVIGIERIERQIRNMLYNKSLKIPVFFYWVEPFLSAGHILYIPTDVTSNIESQIYESIFFKYNVIDKSEYLSSNEKLRKNESGCQGSFVPYSEIYVRKFIISTIDEILSLLKEKPSKPISITWIGNINKLRENEIKISEWAYDMKEGYINKVTYDN